MKPFLTLFFLCQNFNYSVSLVNQTQLEFEKNDGQVEVEQEKFHFDLSEQIIDDHLSVSKSKLIKAKTEAEQLKLQDSLIAEHAQLRLIVDEKLYKKLRVYDQLTTITYSLNLSSEIHFVDGFASDFIRSDFQMVYDQNFQDHSKYHQTGRKTFASSQTSFLNKDQEVYLKRSQLLLKKGEENNYLSFVINLGVDWISLYPEVIETNTAAFGWSINLLLTSMDIEINHEVYHFDQAKIFRMTYFYNQLDQATLLDLKKTYESIFLKKYFAWLEANFLKINFDFSTFWKTFNFTAFNPKLVLNDLQFILEGHDLLNQKLELKMHLLLVYQQQFVWTEPQDYELIDLNELTTLLASKILEQGMDLSWFDFQIEPNQVIISSQNLDLLNFEPIIITYKLVSKNDAGFKEADLIPDKGINKDEQIPSLAKFNWNYFYLLIIPLTFLIIYLTLLFVQKLKKQKAKMIK